MEHKHEPQQTIDGTIKCRICGEVLPIVIETVAKVQSAKMANAILGHHAVDGKYIADSILNDFVVFRRETSNRIEEITARRVDSHMFEVIKTTTLKEGV